MREVRSAGTWGGTLARPVRIVVGEGRTAQQGLLRFVLEGEGYDVVGEAKGTSELSGVIEANRPDVVVLDDGIGVVAVSMVHEVAPQAKVVLVWPSAVVPIGGDARVEPAKILRDLGPAVAARDGAGHGAHGDVRAARLDRSGPQGPGHAAEQARRQGDDEAPQRHPPAAAQPAPPSQDQSSSSGGGGSSSGGGAGNARGRDPGAGRDAPGRARRSRRRARARHRRRHVRRSSGRGVDRRAVGVEPAPRHPRAERRGGGERSGARARPRRRQGVGRWGPRLGRQSPDRPRLRAGCDRRSRAAHLGRARSRWLRAGRVRSRRPRAGRWHRRPHDRWRPRWRPREPRRQRGSRDRPRAPTRAPTPGTDPGHRPWTRPRARSWPRPRTRSWTRSWTRRRGRR